MPSTHASGLLGNLDLWGCLCCFTEPSMSESKLCLPALVSAPKKGGTGGAKPVREKNHADGLNMRGKRLGACAIIQGSIVELYRELYVALALRAIDQTEIEVEPYAGRIQNGGVCNIEEFSPEFQPLGFAQWEFLLDA